MQRQRPPKPIKKRPSRQAKTVVSAAPPSKKPTGKSRLALTIAAIVLVIAIIASAAYYMVAVQPFQRVILSVGDDSIKTGYFLKRMVASQGMTADSVIQSLTAELIIRQQAAAMGFPAVTEQDINDYLRNIAKGENETISDADYSKWFQERLDTTGLTAEEFNKVIGGEILAQSVQDTIGAQVNPQVPQSHVWIIVLDTQENAANAKARIDGGESFDTVAKEVSLDTTSKENGGDMGWQIPELFSTQISSVIDTLDIGKCSDPVAFSQQDSTTGATNTSYLLLMVSEKSAAMQATDTQLSQLKYKAFLDWLSAQEASTEIVFHGLNGSTTLDDQTSTWITYQVQKLIRKLPSSTTTGTTP